MATSDTLRYMRIPLGHGSGAIPAVGFGTLIPDPVVTKQATETALKIGFRHLNCAERYRNEEAVGDAMQEAFKAGRILREEVFVTTKLWNTNHRPERVKPAFDASRRRLNLIMSIAISSILPLPFDLATSRKPEGRARSGNL
jgi:diketogulonate reductase-like aldo/keto reductase